MMVRTRVGVVVTTLLTLLLCGASVGATKLNSTNFTIDDTVGGSIAGQQSSTNYILTSSGGESVIGNGASGSYKLGQGYASQLQNTLLLTIQPVNQKIYYPMDENTGTAVWDSSATASNATTTGTPSWTTGKVSNGITLNGSSQSITGQDVDISTAITVEMWVKPTTGSQTAKLISKESTTSDSQALLQLSSGAPVFGLTTSGAGTTVSASAGTISTGVWTHLVGTYDGTNVRLYVNGSLGGTSASTSGTIANNNLSWTIGKSANAATSYFDGAVDEFKVFDRAFTVKEVKAEYDAGNAGLPAGISLNSITPGVSQISGFDAIMQTDAPGYTLALNQNNNLTSGANTIPAVSGSIGTPVAWSEGSTKGLGFTLYGTNATAIPGKWSTGAAYAALPASATSFYTRTGYTSGSQDVLNMRVRADVALSQVAGDYTNQMTITGTVTP